MRLEKLEKPGFINDPALRSIRFSQSISGPWAERPRRCVLTSRVAIGRVDLIGISDGGRLESYAIAPNKLLLVMKIDSVGVMRKGANLLGDGQNSYTWDVRDRLAPMAARVHFNSCSREFRLRRK